MPARLVDRFAVLEVRADVVVEDRQGGADGHVHVQVLVGAQASAEEDLVSAGFLGGEASISFELGAAVGGVDRVVDLDRHSSRKAFLTPL